MGVKDTVVRRYAHTPHPANIHQEPYPKLTLWIVS